MYIIYIVQPGDKIQKNFFCHILFQKTSTSSEKEPTESSPVDLDKVPGVQKIHEALRELHETGENLVTLNNYKEASKKLLLGIS